MLKPTRQPLLAGRETEPDSLVYVFPVPELPTAMMFSRHLTCSPRRRLQHEGALQATEWRRRSNMGRFLHGRELRLLDPTLRRAPFRAGLSSSSAKRGRKRI